jgi:hypothetical protein
MPSLIFLWKAWVYLDFWPSEHNCTLALESQWLRGGSLARQVCRFVWCSVPVGAAGRIWGG